MATLNHCNKQKCLRPNQEQRSPRIVTTDAETIANKKPNENMNKKNTNDELTRSEETITAPENISGDDANRPTNNATETDKSKDTV